MTPYMCSGGYTRHMHLRELAVGDTFRWGKMGFLYEYRGNGWYSSPGGCDGGPWHATDDPVVLRTDR